MSKSFSRQASDGTRPTVLLSLDTDSAQQVEVASALIESEHSALAVAPSALRHWSGAVQLAFGTAGTTSCVAV
jgi:hypothetical protein